MVCFWRKLHAVSLLVGFVLEFAAAGRVDGGASLASVAPLIIMGLVLMVAFWLPAVREEWREYNE